MQAVILAAGRSRRMGKITKEIPKCLIEIHGKTILGRTLENLIDVGVDELVITVGYLQNMIRDFISANFPNLRVKYLVNEDYENNNNIYSLWMTKDAANGPILLLDSDIVFDTRILHSLLKYPQENCLAVRTSDTIGQEEMKVTLQDNSEKLAKISKKIDPKEAFGESIGIELFSPEFLRELYRILDRRILKEKKINDFYEIAFQEMIDNSHPIYAVDIGPKKAAELDFPEDIEDARTNVIPYLDKT